MKHFRRPLSHALRLLTILCWGCVEHAPVEGAPCPCPGGYACCETLGTCVARDRAEACPDEQPASSARACERDAECAPGELCEAWQDSGGELAGPRQCRKSCGAAKPCAEGESCQLVPHDGISLYEADLARACVAPRASCTCKDCEPAQLGRTYCEDLQIKSCFIAFDELCGVSCELVVVQTCVNGCESEAERMACLANGDGGGPCWKYPCSACASEPGTSSCEGGQLSTCTRASYAGEECSELCLPTTTACAANQQCQPEPMAHCGP